MQPFMYWNPVKWLFGKGSIGKLPQELAPFGQKILMVYGGGSIKQNGVYDAVLDQLATMNTTIFELSGVEPNPRLATVRKGIELCKQEEIDFLLAVGGGSVIDCTKAIAAGACYDGDIWDIITKKTPVERALPLGTVLTLAATGSEMNSGSVITNWETQEKLSWGSPFVFPKFSICDPIYTTTVPYDHTVYGIVDMMCHILEQYFHQTDHTILQDRFCESALKTVIETAPKLLADLSNEQHRETIMYTGTIALNGMLQMGYRGDWASHNIEHAVSAVYDIPHAGGLAILYPNWMKHTIWENPTRFSRLAIQVFDVDPEGKTNIEIGLEGINKLRQFWTDLGAPTHLSDYNIDGSHLDEIADKAMLRGEFGNFKKLNKDDVKAILQASL